jgi:hypothetical protein
MTLFCLLNANEISSRTLSDLTEVGDRITSMRGQLVTDYDRRMRNAYAMNNYTEAKEALQKIFRQLERINPSAARSLEEGLEETLTVHRLGIGAVLRRKLATTNLSLAN